LLSQQATAQERSRASARKTAEISNVRYRAGLVSYLEVVESERTALTAERESARLAGQRLVTSVQLIKALGGGWADSALPRLAARQK
jgi:multidrug efflux system outer membrane protein